ANAGLVRFAAPIPGAGSVQVRADYTPTTLRITSGAGADSSPVILMDDSPNNLAHPYNNNGAAAGATVRRHTLWAVWRRSVQPLNSVARSSIYYSAYRLQVTLP